MRLFPLKNCILDASRIFPKHFWRCVCYVCVCEQDCELKRTVEESERIQRAYGHYFDLTIVNDNLDGAYRSLKGALERLSTEHQWVPVSWVFWATLRFIYLYSSAVKCEQLVNKPRKLEMNLETVMFKYYQKTLVFFSWQLYDTNLFLPKIRDKILEVVCDLGETGCVFTDTCYAPSCGHAAI